jgi:hypothetical protein
VTTRRTLFWHSVMPRTVEESTTLAIDAGGQVGQAPGRPGGGLPTAQGRSSHTFGISAKVVSRVTWVEGE